MGGDTGPPLESRPPEATSAPAPGQELQAIIVLGCKTFGCGHTRAPKGVPSCSGNNQSAASPHSLTRCAGTTDGSGNSGGGGSGGSGTMGGPGNFGSGNPGGPPDNGGMSPGKPSRRTSRNESRW